MITEQSFCTCRGKHLLLGSWELRIASRYIPYSVNEKQFAVLVLRQVFNVITTRDGPVIWNWKSNLGNWMIRLRVFGWDNFSIMLVIIFKSLNKNPV